MPRIPRRKKASLPTEELLVGVDGGATEVKVHEILVLEREEGVRLDLGPASASVLYDRVRRFQPAPMAQQILEEQRGECQLAPEEAEEGRLILAAFVRAITSVAEQSGRRRLRIGVCLPGGKSVDGRGVLVMRNGPRMPRFLAELEAALIVAGLELAAPIPALLSDGDACAHGENLGLGGLFADVPNAYYIGGGTGLAESFKLEGQVVGLDALRPWLRKAWQLEDERGRSFEDIASARGLNERYAERVGGPERVGSEEYPEQRVALGDPDAEAVLREAASTLAALVFSRLRALQSAEKLPRTRGTERAPRTSFKLKPATVLQRVVIGQQLGRLFADPALAVVLREPLEEELARLLLATRDDWLAQHYLEGRAIRPGLIVASLLRAAPALGAGAASLGRALRRSPAAAEATSSAGASAPGASAPTPSAPGAGGPAPNVPGSSASSATAPGVGAANPSAPGPGASAAGAEPSEEDPRG